jgi:bHLH-MYC and R2R3-MYB transcription factors N-terminal
MCHKTVDCVVLFPMSFRDIDDAHKAMSSIPGKMRGRKRKSIPGAVAGTTVDVLDETGSYISERRTGRWTLQEMTYCDKLMAKFSSGEIPVADGVKLNEFLGAMLKSKQSRLTKKMKNAKLSTKSFQRVSGFLNVEEACEFSQLEEAFFGAVTDALERAEIKFHMQKEWREQFSRVCAEIGQPIDADSWLSSVEEMDRRASVAKDAARMTRRKLMIGVALRTDSQNQCPGVFIEKTEADVRASGYGTDDGLGGKDVEEELFSMLGDDKGLAASLDVNGKSSQLHSAPFLAKTMAYLQRHSIPFEHVDLWVPSFVPGSESDSTSCRLCYAGSVTTDKIVGEDGKSTRTLTSEEQFNLHAFGDYSQKFSFDVGFGLPGRVYESGRPTWEQRVHNAPHTHFERCGGALQWGIKTVVGIPIASPNVGRIVVALYSTEDRSKDEDLVVRLSEEFTRVSCMGRLAFRFVACF